MNRDELPELHFITVADNVPSVLQRGILSHTRASSVHHQSIAMQEIQDRRQNKRIPGGRALHDYANLYINGRNKMMFKVQATRGVADVIVLRVSADVLDLPGVVIADRNASSDHVRFGPFPVALARIDREVVFARYWTHPDDEIAEMEHGSRICAEVLVPDAVPAGYILGAYVPDQPARERLLASAQDLAIMVHGDIFFR